MAPIPTLLTLSASDGTSTYPVYTSAVLLATFSFIILLLIIPPMCRHFRNRNLGATMLVAWIIILNLQSFINSLLWSNDNVHQWYNGSGLCDVEVKLQVASQVALPAALCCVLRALAEVMDTSRATLVKTKAQRRRSYAVDLLFCVAFPLLQMISHYIVQDSRYALYGISGCSPVVQYSWVSIVLIYIPPMVWSLINAYYAIQILVRLYHYRRAFNSILVNSNTPKSRFIRLYILCLLWIFGSVPVGAYLLYFNLEIILSTRGHFSWSQGHSAATWDNIEIYPSGGRILADRYIWLAEAIVVFIFFGFGKEAVGMYRSGLLTLGFGRVFPSLNPEHARRSSVTGTISSFGSRAKLLFKRKSSASFYTDSTASRTMSAVDPLSPRNATFLETIREGQDHDEKQSRISTISRVKDTEKITYSSKRLPAWSRLTSVFTTRFRRNEAAADELVLTGFNGQQATIRSNISLGERSPTLSEPSHSLGPCEVIVRKEIRQGSEPAETFGVVYHAA